MIVFEGDYVKCYNREEYLRVDRIVDQTRVELSNGRIVPADSDVIEDLKSYLEYEKFCKDFELEDGYEYE